MQLAEALTRVDELKAEIDRLRPLKPETEQRIMQKFRLDWNYNSNAIEGNSLTLGETRAFLLEGLTANGKPFKDHVDIRGHNELIDFLSEFINQNASLTEVAIREMHRILLIEAYAVDVLTPDGKMMQQRAEIGVFKTKPNCRVTATGETQFYELPEVVPQKMKSLLDWLSAENEKAEIHPVLQAAIFHHRFLVIHPFADGNGRMARVLMNLIVMRAGFPPIVVKMTKRDAYISSLKRADAGELDSLSLFLTEELIASEELYLKGAKGSSVEDYDDVDKEIALLKQELKQVHEPVQLDEGIFRKLWVDSLLPLLKRIDDKMSAFDDLFTKNSVLVRTPNQGHRPFHRKELQQSIKELFFNSNFPRQVGISFHWEGFKKAGTNDFNYSFELDLGFQDRKWLLKIRWNEAPRVRTYQNLLSEDDVKELVNSIAKDCLSQIQRGLSTKA